MEEELGRGHLECIIQPSHLPRGLADHHLSTDFSKWIKEAWNSVISGEEQAGPKKWAWGQPCLTYMTIMERGRVTCYVRLCCCLGTISKSLARRSSSVLLFLGSKVAAEVNGSWEKVSHRHRAIVRPADGTLLQCLRIVRLASSFGIAGTTLGHHAFSLGSSSKIITWQEGVGTISGFWEAVNWLQKMSFSQTMCHFFSSDLVISNGLSNYNIDFNYEFFKSSLFLSVF